MKIQISWCLLKVHDLKMLGFVPLNPTYGV